MADTTNTDSRRFGEPDEPTEEPQPEDRLSSTDRPYPHEAATPGEHGQPPAEGSEGKPTDGESQREQ